MIRVFTNSVQREFAEELLIDIPKQAVSRNLVALPLQRAALNFRENSLSLVLNGAQFSRKFKAIQY